MKHARKLNDFTSIQERCRDGVEGIGSTDKKNLTEVDGDIDVMVLRREAPE